MFSFFDWKINMGIFLTVMLAIGGIMSFILAWFAPVATDVHFALGRYIHYRWFAFYVVGSFSIGTATFTYHQKRLNKLFT